MRNQFNTIEEQLNRWYGGPVTKADAPLLSTTTGAFNAIYGSQAFFQLNISSPVWGALQKYPWQHSGWRAITGYATNSSIGLSEGANLPDSTKPNFAQIDIKPKQVAQVFESSYMMDGLANTDDTLSRMETLRPHFAEEHGYQIDKMLLKDCNTLAGLDMESIDRVTANTAAQVTALGYNAGDEDIYGIDRSQGANSWARGVTMAAANTNANSRRTLTLKMVSDGMAAAEAAGGKTTLIVTGPDTKWRLVSLAQTQVRYMGGVVKREVGYSIGVNGVNTDEGMGHGVKISEIYGVPLIASHNVQKDSLSRIYLLDTSNNPGSDVPRLGIALLYPTMYYESGMATGDPFTVNKLATKGMYVTMGELVCTFFGSQIQIRDLK